MSESIMSTLPIYLSVLLGYILKKKKVLPENAAKTVAVVAFNIAVPFLIFNVLYGLKFTAENLHMVYFVLILIAAVLTIFYLYGKITKTNKKTIGSILGASMGFGIGSFAYPFILASFPNDVFQNVVLLDIVHFILMVTVGYLVVALHGDKSAVNLTLVKQKLLLNPIVIAIVVTLGINYLNVSVSQGILDASSFFSRSFAFLATFLLGLTLELPNFKKAQRLTSVFLIRFVGVLVVIVLLVKLLPFSSVETKAVYLAFLTPFAVLPVIFAEEQGTDTAIISQLALFSSLIYLFLYPLVIVLVQSM
jgi:malate permease and related proteins